MRALINELMIAMAVVICVPVFSVFGQPSGMRITTGSLAGATIKIIAKDTVSKTVVANSQSIVSQTQRVWPVTFELEGQRTNLSATLVAYVYKVGIERNGTNHPVSFLALVIESNTEPPLWWFCARPTGATVTPRDFKVFVTTNGSTYASFFLGGPTIFRVSGMKNIEAAWREYWEQWGGNEEEVDAIKPLRIDVLFQAIGRSPWSDNDARHLAGTVDDIYEIDGELRVVLHARRPEPKHTFALRHDKWELISSTGKEVSDTIIEQARRKALVEQFEAEVKAKGEGKDPYEGTTRDNAMRKRIERIEAELSAKADQTNNTSGVQTNK